MKELKSEYDHPDFFKRYAQMDRSRRGLSAAGEWHQLRPLFPDLKGKSVLDLGCGYGWHCAFAKEQGAARILGIDSSERMIEEARRRNGMEGVEYRACGMEHYDYPKSAWDCVISNLALHYVEDLEAVFRNVYRTLKPGGVFLMNIEHPVFTAGVNQDWAYDENGRPKYWPVDGYFTPGERHTRFLGCDVVKQHHTLTQILTGLLKGGFELEHVQEAEPPREWLDQPGMADELRRPMMLLIRARKAHPRIILSTERLILREMTQDDLPDLAEMLQDPDVMYAYEHDFSDEDVQNWLDRQRRRYREDGFGLWAAILKATGEIVGQAGLTIQPHREESVLEVGYLLKKRFWHCGYAREAARACRDYAFGALDRDRVYSVIKADNLPSQRVARANGMVKVDEFIARYYNGDMLHFLYRADRP